MTKLLLLLAFSQDLSQQGAQAMRERRFADAERIYRELIKQEPANAGWQLNLGLALHSARKYAQAIPALNSFLKSNPKPGPVYLVLGTAHLKAGKFCEAIAPLEIARSWEASPQVLVELGDAYSGCKRYVEAARTYQAAKQPRAAARAHWQAREYDRAKAIYAAIEPQHRSDPEFLYEYGDTLARLEGAEAGLPYLEESVKKAPDLIPARGALGRALMEANRAAESISHLSAAAPSDVTLLLPLSRAYKATGRPEEAARIEAEYRRKMADQN